MAISKLHILFLLCIILSFHHVLSYDEDVLLTSINNYRTSINLTTLSKNDNAECLAEKIADQFKNRPCTNTTGSASVPGTEPSFPNFLDLLTKCRLNVTVTRDGEIMPACVPDLEHSLVVTNFTKSQYSRKLNDSRFSGIGIGSENHWIVVILTTTTPEGGYSTATKDDFSGAFAFGLSGFLMLLHLFCFFMF